MKVVAAGAGGCCDGVEDYPLEPLCLSSHTILARAWTIILCPTAHGPWTVLCCPAAWHGGWSGTSMAWGKLSSWFTSIPGSSRYFKEGVIVYSNESKHKYCGVSMDLIERKGAVCQSVSIDLAKGIQKFSGATWGIGITGIAGPSGGSEEKPVGTVHITVYGNDQVHHKHCTFHGTRDQITDQACGQAVFMLFNAMRSA